MNERSHTMGDSEKNHEFELEDNSISVSPDGLQKIPDPGLLSLIRETIWQSMEAIVKPEFNCLRGEIEELKSENRQLRETVNKFHELMKQVYPQSSVNYSKESPSFADIAAGTQSVVVRPKKSDQSVSKTKLDILKNVDPIASGVTVNRVKAIRDGGVVIRSKQSEEFKRIASEKLSGNYEIHQLKTPSPSVRVVGISEYVDKELVVPYILKQNESVFQKDSVCDLISFTRTKRKQNVLQATLQLDLVSYKKILECGHLLVGFDVCAVYDAISPVRCFKCNGYNHTSKYCKNKLSCPKCAQPHQIKDCPEENEDKFTCVNCVELNAKNGSQLPVNHAVWDSTECTALKLTTDKLKKDLFDLKK